MIEILSWRTELELGDIGRSEIIPHTLGAWEYFECDIVNQQDPFWGIAADPKGIDPPIGGEINIYPSKTWTEQINTIKPRKLIEV